MPFGRGRRARLVGISLALVAAAGAVVPATASPRTGSDAFAQLVAEWASLASERELERRALELARMPGALESYFELAAADAVPGTDGEWLPLGEDQLRLLRRAADLFDPSAVIQYVRGGLATAPGEPWRRTALVLIGLHGGSAQLSLLSQLAHDGDAAPHPGLVEPFTEALAAVLRREGARPHELQWLASEAPALVEAMIRAVGRAGRSEGLDWLTGFLQDQQLGSPALQEIGRLAGGARGECASETAAAVLPLLSSRDDARRRGALRALGALQQPTSLPRLVLHLEHVRTRSEREMTLSALRAISGLNLPGDAAAWEDWLRREKLWLAESAKEALARLASEDAAEVVAAVHELSLHPLHRERFAPPLAVLLAKHASPSVRAQICFALARLGSETPVPQLLAVLEDDDPHVRESALRALRTLTGIDAGTNRREWQEELDARAANGSSRLLQ